MKWEYESISLIENENKDSLLFKPIRFGQSIIKSYFMWIWISELKFDLSLEKRKEYLCQYYSISLENLVIDILNLEINKEEQEVLIYFYYLKNEEIEEIYELISKSEKRIKEIYEMAKDTYLSKKSLLLKEIKDKDYLEKLVNLSFGEGVKILPYISLIDKKQMNLHYMEGKGAIIALGYEFTLDTIRPYNHEDTLDKLKALGDETRLRITELILEKRMSASELSKTLDLTIPTIAHHLRVLASAGLIKSFIDEEGGSKTTYKIYSLGLDDLINNISYLNSGDIK